MSTVLAVLVAVVGGAWLAAGLFRMMEVHGGRPEGYDAFVLWSGRVALLLVVLMLLAAILEVRCA